MPRIGFWPTLIGVTWLVGGRSIPPSAATSRPADLVIYGRVWTGDSAHPWAEGIAITGDSITGVGDSGRIAQWVGRRTRVLNNGTAMVAPGFMDEHVHF